MTGSPVAASGQVLPRLVGMLDSPYVRRVAIAMDVLGLPFEHEPLSVFSTFEQFRAVNPVVKAPTYICSDGTVLMESSLILQYIEADSDVALWPAAPADRRAAFRAVGLALAACEKGAQLVYERQLRPVEKQFAPWCERVRSQMLAAWTMLEAQVAGTPVLFADACQHPAMSTAVVWQFARSMLAEDIVAAAFPAIAELAARLERSAHFLAYPPAGPGVPAQSA
jgi:glutathione S-transferase